MDGFIDWPVAGQQARDQQAGDGMGEDRYLHLPSVCPMSVCRCLDGMGRWREPSSDHQILSATDNSELRQRLPHNTHRYYTDLRQVDNPFIGPHSVLMAAR